jgi:hypothetical protein
MTHSRITAAADLPLLREVPGAKPPTRLLDIVLALAGAARFPASWERQAPRRRAPGQREHLQRPTCCHLDERPGGPS